MGKIRLIAIGWVLILGVLFQGEPGAEEWAVVRHVSDGDTVVLVDGRRVRYADIDAPEIAHKDKRAEPFGYAAKKYNKKIVHSKKVRLEFGKPDRYGRQTAHVFLAGGTHVNVDMLEKGLAWYMAHGGGKYAAIMLKAQRSAMSSSNGLWRLSNLRENRSYAGNGRTLRFHSVACRFGKKISKKNRILFNSKWDAFHAGHSPCAKCLPFLDE